MAERYEIVIDFSKYKPGQQVIAQEHEPEEQHRLRHDRRRHAQFVVGAHVTDPR